MTIAEFLQPQHWLSQNTGPRYVQLRKRLYHGVETGILNAGSALPPEREIAAITHLSRVTVRKAIQALVSDGTIVQKQGSGSFVAPKPPQLAQSLSRLTSFSEDLALRGMLAANIWLERGVFPPSPDEMLHLALAPDATVARIARVRTADGKPMAIERSSLPTRFLPDPQAVDSSLYEVLDTSGFRPARALQKITALNLSQGEADLLRVEPAMAALRIERISYLADERPVEFTQSIYRADAYNFVAELRVVGQKKRMMADMLDGPTVLAQPTCPNDPHHHKKETDTR